MKKTLFSLLVIVLATTTVAQDEWQCEFSTLETNKEYLGKYAPVKTPVTISQSGMIFQTGRYDMPIMIGESFLDNIATSAFVAALDSKGNHLWAIGLRGAARITATTTDSEDNLYITGLFADDVILGSTDYAEQFITGCPDTHEMASAFVAKYNKEGVLQAVKTISISKNESLLNAGEAYTFDGSFSPNALAICGDRLYVSASYAGTYSVDDIHQNSSYINGMGALFDATALCVLSFEKATLSDAKKELDMNNSEMQNALENGPQSIAIATDGQEVYAAMVCTGNSTLTIGSVQEIFNPGTDAFTSIFARITKAEIQAIGTESGNRYWYANEVNAMSIMDGKIYMAGTYSSPLSFAKNEQPDLWCDQWISCFDAATYRQLWCHATDAKRDDMPSMDAKYRYTTMAACTSSTEWKSIGSTSLTLTDGKNFTVDDTKQYLGIAGMGGIVAMTDLTETGSMLTVKTATDDGITLPPHLSPLASHLYYDLQGRTVNPHSKKGVFIHNGKKVVR